MAENVFVLVLLLIYQPSISNIWKSVLKIESIVSLSSRGVAPNKNRPRIRAASISSRTPARLKIIIATASIQIWYAHYCGNDDVTTRILLYATVVVYTNNVILWEQIGIGKQKYITLVQRVLSLELQPKYYILLTHAISFSSVHNIIFIWWYTWITLR